MNIGKVHCMFEQSGTFKKQFKELGINACDYDIENEFGETDVQMDLFAEIERAYAGERSVFDEIAPEDLVMAFFPCIRFEDQVLLWFRGENNAQRKWDLSKKIEYDLQIHAELNQFYSLVMKLVSVAIRGGWKLIIENPYSTQHYLLRYSPLKPSLIDEDRRIRGDYYKKPTMYFFVNCEPSYNFIWGEYSTQEQYLNVASGSIDGLGCKDRRHARSMISPKYANRFIREFVLEGEKREEGFLI